MNSIAYKKKKPNFPWSYFGIRNELLESRGVLKLFSPKNCMWNYIAVPKANTAEDLPLRTSGQLEAKLCNEPLGIH